MMRYALIVLALTVTLASDAFALRDLIGAELFLHSYTGTIFAHSWFGLALTLFVYVAGSLLFVHRSDPTIDMIAFLGWHPINALLGTITAAASIFLFKWPRLTDFEFARNDQIDYTPEYLLDNVCENERAKCEGKGAKWVDSKGAPIVRVQVEQTYTYTAIFFFVFFVLVATAGGYLVSGRGEPDFDDDVAVPTGIALLVVGALGFVAMGAILWWRNVPWSAHPYAGRWTLKYFFFLALFVVPPAFYDYSTLKPFAARATVMAAIYLVLDVAFYFYAIYAGRDPFFSKQYFESCPQIANKRRNDALWWAIIDWITRILAYFSMSIANDLYKGNAAAALAAQAIGTVVTILVYIVIRYTVYPGYYRPDASTYKSS
jgi:hypothetical protein